MRKRPKRVLSSSHVPSALNATAGSNSTHGKSHSPDGRAQHHCGNDV